MISMLVTLLLACGGPTPASIKLDGEAAKTVHTTDAVAVNAASVLDAEGNALAEQPAVVWTVTPDSVAKLDGSNVVPVANGEATITAAVGDIKAEYKLVVALPDSVAISGYDPALPFGVGETKQLAAAVKAGETVIEGQPITWTSDKPEFASVDAAGLITAVAEGQANITATAGALNAAVTVTVAPAAPAAADATAAPQ